MMRKNVLFIGPHPDDIDLGCALTMHDHYLRGDHVSTIVISGGERGGAPAAVRIEEQKSSFSLLAGQVHSVFFNFPDTQLLVYMHEIIESLHRYILDEVPDIVYLPALADYHQDHAVTHQCAMAVLNNQKVEHILAYETPSTMPQFAPTCFKLFGLQVRALKTEALACHKSQQHKQYCSKEAIYALAAMRAAQSRCFDGVAEAFEIIRQLEYLGGL